VLVVSGSGWDNLHFFILKEDRRLGCPEKLMVAGAFLTTGDAFLTFFTKKGE